jgi:hypothetical protein
MKKKVLQAAVLLFSFSAISQSLGSELISSSGAHYSNTNYQLDWSIGECVTATHNTGSYTITQGFHQENYSVSLGFIDTALHANIQVFPNPTVDFISVLLDRNDLVGILSLKITDTKGTVLLQKKINEIGTTIDFSEYASGIYLLFVKRNNQLITSYKIIKE